MKTLEFVKNRIAAFSDEKFGAEGSFTAPLHHMKKEVEEAIENYKK